MLCIIQARSNSKIFKNKVLHPIYGLPLILHVVKRVSKSKHITKLVVSTSLKKSDDNLISYLKKNNVKVFRGNLNNVAERLYKTAKKYKAKSFIRISGDSPLIDYKLLDRLINIYNNGKFDICTNVMNRSFPKGQSIEVFSTNIFLQNFFNIKNCFYLEHVTKYFYKNYKIFKIFNLSSEINYSKINLSVDTKKDFDKISKLIKITKGKYASWKFYSKLYKEKFND